MVFVVVIIFLLLSSGFRENLLFAFFLIRTDSFTAPEVRLVQRQAKARRRRATLDELYRRGYSLSVLMKEKVRSFLFRYDFPG